LSTIYDLVTVALFAGLVILFLQRSVDAENTKDKMIHYLPPAVGCAGANWLGNNHQDALAIVSLVAVVIYSYFVLKPFAKSAD